MLRYGYVKFVTVFVVLEQARNNLNRCHFFPFVIKRRDPLERIMLQCITKRKRFFNFFYDYFMNLIRGLLHSGWKGGATLHERVGYESENSFCHVQDCVAPKG